MSEVIDGEVIEPGQPGETIGEPMADVRDDLRRARELIPADRGMTPQNLAQLVDVARDMAKARFSLPEHLHNNVGDCLAIIDIANRANLSPYMLALETYVDPKTKRLAFQSRAYHALAQNWLIGDLDIEYFGEGDDMICIVRGRSKKDPSKVREHASPRLGDVRPRRNAEGVVKGSPLWDRKPKMQIAYDTVRDWVRMHCPQATLGIYVPEELEEYADEMDAARRAVREQERSGVSDRLANGKVDRTEGHRGVDHVHAELDQIAPASGGREIKPAKAADAPAQAAATVAQPEPGKPTSEAPKPKAKKAAKADEPKPTFGSPSLDKAAAEAALDKAAAARSQPEAGAQPSAQPEAPPQATQQQETARLVASEQAATWQDYLKLWEQRLEAATSGDIAAEWKRERTIREKLKMPSEEITEFRNKVDRKAASLPRNTLAGG